MILPKGNNPVIYGHHIKGGKMFGALEDYKSKSFYEKTRIFSLIPSQSRQSMKSSLYLRLWRTVLMASVTTTLLMRKMKKNLIPMSGSARNLLCMIQVLLLNMATGSLPFPPANTPHRTAGSL